MIAAEPINADQAHRILGGRPGLVIGPAVSMRTDEASVRRDISELAISTCSDVGLRARLDGGDDIWELLDVYAAADSGGYEQFRSKAERYFRDSKQAYAIDKISRAPWSVVMSLCRDPHIEDAIRHVLASKPTQRRVTVVTAPTVLGRPAMQLPVYKLMGSCLDASEGSRLAMSRSEYLVRRSEWRRLLSGVSDYVRECGLVFLGTDGFLQDVQDLLSTLYSGPAPYPSSVLFAESDPAGLDPIVERLTRGRSELHRFKGDHQRLLDLMVSPAGAQLGFSFSSASGRRGSASEFQSFRALVDVVPLDKPSYQFSSRRQEALEGLFRPNGTLWDAFLFDLDLKRSTSADLFRRLNALQTQVEKRPKFLVLRGEAGVGKTVVAKRLAVDLRRAGHVVLWCKKTNGEFFHLYRELAKEIKAMQAKHQVGGYFMFWDDPWALGLAPVEFAAALDSEGVDITVTIITRNSDKAVAHGFARLPPIDDEVEIDFEMTGEEEAQLPGFLIKVGAVSDVKDANRILDGFNGRNARDILCRLWYLLPDTREQIEHALSDEYFRLESVDRLINSLAQSAEASGATARRAYEAVAVASGLGLGIPTEVLVNALRVNYSEWVSMCAGGRPLWGLLYPVEHADTEQYWYFTRNEVVTQILLKQVNGGVGHAAEARVLRSLVEACSGTSPVYRDFLVELLVRSKERLKKIVTAREGQELYEVALRTFPVPDRTLVHHYAKWVTDEVRDNKEAYEILQRALETADYPYSSHEERREHVHTSMAAVLVQLIKRGDQDRESGLLAIKRHLREASTPTFFNLYTVHVQVNALVRLQQGDDPFSLDCFVEACRALERAQQLAGASGRRQLRYREALEMLENQKRELAASLAPFDHLKEDAIRRFEASGDQLPLEAAALKGLIEASLTDKGSNYNEVHQYIGRCVERISKRKQQMAPALRQVRVDLIVRWRLQHDIGEVDWNMFLGDVRVIREEPSKRDDILLLFYEAVACFHLRLMTEAQAAFVRLRALQIPGQLSGHGRVYLRSRSGKPEQVQGILMKGGARGRVRLADFGYDVPILRDRAPANVQEGATVHCWISFSLQGPLAEFHAPESADVLLPS